MDHFMARCMMLPPPDPLAAKPFEIKQNVGSSGCCGKKERVVVIMPNTTMQRATHQLHHRERVIQEHDAELMTSTLTKEPTVEELESKPTPFASHLTLRDKIVGVVTAVVCVAVMLLLNLRDFAPRVRIPAGADV